MATQPTGASTGEGHEASPAVVTDPAGERPSIDDGGRHGPHQPHHPPHPVERLRTFLLGPVPIEGDDEDHSAEEVIPADAGFSARYGRFLLAAVLGVCGTTLIAASAPVWYLAAPSWRLTIPGIAHPGSSFQAIATFLVGLVLMSLGWVTLIGRAERAPISAKRRLVVVVAVGTLWCLPVLLSTPLLSHDVYSYAAQGEMASRGIDPSANGPNSLGARGPFVRAADRVWRDSPSPYGPVAVGTGAVVVTLTGHDAAAAVWGFRVVAALGVVMAGFGVALIARSYHRSPALAVAVGVVNPLVLLHLIGGSHNDAIMVGLLALGFAAFLRQHKVTAVVLIAMATAVKIPAAAGLVFVAWNWDDDPDLRVVERVRRTALVLLGASAVIGVLCVVCGVGAGFITSLQSTGKVFSTFSVATKLGFVSAGLLHGLGLGIDESIMVAIFRLLGMAVAGGLSLLLVLRSPRSGVVRAFALSSLVIVVLGPVVWPWYLAGGFALMAASGMGKWRPSYVVLIVSASALVWPTSVEPVKSLTRYQHLLSLVVILAIGAAAAVAQRLAAHLEATRSAGPGPGAASGETPPRADDDGPAAATSQPRATPARPAAVGHRPPVVLDLTDA